MSPPSSENPWRTFAVVAGGAYLSAFGTSSVPVLLPLVRSDLHVALGDVAWIVTAYLLTITALLLSAGRLGDLRGHREAYVIGFAVLGAGAVASAVAPSLALLVLARAVQGAGAAVLTANGPALLTTSFPSAKRGQVLGLQATVVYAGLTTGPALGGLVARHLDWRPALALIAPFALVGALLAARALPAHVPGMRPARTFDATGAVLFGVALVAALGALGRGGEWGWTDARTLGGLVLAAVALVLFARHLRTAGSPIVPPDLLGAPPFSLGLGAAMLQYVVVATVTLLVPFELRAADLDAQASGWVLSVQPAVMMATAAWSGRLADRVGTRVPATIGMALLALGVQRLGAIGTGAHAVDFVAPLATIGLGAGLFTPANNSSILGAAPLARQGVAGGMAGTARNVGMAIGVAVSGSFLAAARSGVDTGSQSSAIVDACRRALGAAVLVAGAGALLSLFRAAAPREPPAC